MPETVSRSHVIADRYLTSPAALAAQPFGPVDALDTHSGRGAQVRIVFVAGECDEADLADAVARWCGIGCSEVCGVLDFGRHRDRWFLVLPPSVGLPVERWRMLRRPTAADAARLTLAFGRLTERVAAAGFSPDAAALADVAVGPGPTPFLERPLLPAVSRRPVAQGDGQRILAAVYEAALGPADPPAGLYGWGERARAGQFASLSECLDELERSRAEGDGQDTQATDLPPGLEHLFDDDFDLDGPAVTAPPPRRFRRVGGVITVVLGVFVALSALLDLAHVTPASTAQRDPETPTVTPVTNTAAGRGGQNPLVHTRPTHRTVAKPPHAHRRHRSVPPAPPPATPSTPSPSTPAPTYPAGAVYLPEPSPVGVVLPAP
ncbi:MAG: hypothetical protein ABJB93_01745 [Gaiellales bacterium]